MSGEVATATVEQKPASNDSAPPLSNAQLTQEVAILKRQNIDLTNQVMNLLSRVGKLDRDVRMAGNQRGRH
jgi:hypothetical protein